MKKIEKIFILLVIFALFANCSVLNTETEGQDDLALIAALAVSNGQIESSNTGSGENPDVNLVIESHTPTTNEVVVNPTLVNGKTKTPTTSIVLNFSEAVNKTSLESAFSVKRGGTIFAGNFVWENGDTKVTWTPTNYLRAYAVHTVTIADSAETVTGKLLASEYSFDFRIGPFFIRDGKHWMEGNMGDHENLYNYCALNDGACTFAEAESFCSQYGMAVPTRPEVEAIGGRYSTTDFINLDSHYFWTSTEESGGYYILNTSGFHLYSPTTGAQVRCVLR